MIQVTKGGKRANDREVSSSKEIKMEVPRLSIVMSETAGAEEVCPSVARD